MKQDRILRECLRISREKNLAHPLRSKGWKYIHWSFIIQDEKIISVGMNRDAAIEVILPGRKDGRKIHAEQDAVRRARNTLQLSKHWYMVNVRLNKKGLMRNSAPCSRCRSISEWLGMDRIIFTINEGWATWLNPYEHRRKK